MNGVLLQIGCWPRPSCPAPAGDICRRSRLGTASMTILNDILDFSKIGAGKFRLAQPLRPASCWRTPCCCSPRTRTPELSLVLDVAPEAALGADRRRGPHRQIVTNLVSNAVKFTDRGPGRGLRAAVLRNREDRDVRHCRARYRHRLRATGPRPPVQRLRPDRHLADAPFGGSRSRTRDLPAPGADDGRRHPRPGVPGEGACFEGGNGSIGCCATETGEGAEAVPPPVSIPALLAMRDRTLARALAHILALRGGGGVPLP